MNTKWWRSRLGLEPVCYVDTPKTDANHCAHVTLYYRRWAMLLRTVPYTADNFAYFDAYHRARIYSYFQE